MYKLHPKTNYTLICLSTQSIPIISIVNLKTSSYLGSSQWSWRAALTPSPGVGTLPCSSSEPNTKPGSPPAAPQCASDLPPSPKDKTQSYYHKHGLGQSWWMSDIIIWSKRGLRSTNLCCCLRQKLNTMQHKSNKGPSLCADVWPVPCRGPGPSAADCASPVGGLYQIVPSSLPVDPPTPLWSLVVPCYPPLAPEITTLNFIYVVPIKSCLNTELTLYT